MANDPASRPPEAAALEEGHFSDVSLDPSPAAVGGAAGNAMMNGSAPPAKPKPAKPPQRAPSGTAMDASASAGGGGGTAAAAGRSSKGGGGGASAAPDSGSDVRQALRTGLALGRFSYVVDSVVVLNVMNLFFSMACIAAADSGWARGRYNTFAYDSEVDIGWTRYTTTTTGARGYMGQSEDALSEVSKAGLAMGVMAFLGHLASICLSLFSLYYFYHLMVDGRLGAVASRLTRAKRLAGTLLGLGAYLLGFAVIGYPIAIKKDFEGDLDNFQVKPHWAYALSLLVCLSSIYMGAVLFRGADNLDHIVAERAGPGSDADAPVGLCANLSLAAAGAWSAFGELVGKAQGPLTNGSGAPGGDIRETIRATLAIGRFTAVPEAIGGLMGLTVIFSIACMAAGNTGWFEGALTQADDGLGTSYKCGWKRYTLGILSFFSRGPLKDLSEGSEAVGGLAFLGLLLALFAALYAVTYVYRLLVPGNVSPFCGAHRQARLLSAALITAGLVLFAFAVIAFPIVIERDVKKEPDLEGVRVKPSWAYALAFIVCFACLACGTLLGRRAAALDQLMASGQSAAEGGKDGAGAGQAGGSGASAAAAGGNSIV